MKEFKLSEDVVFKLYEIDYETGCDIKDATAKALSRADISFDGLDLEELMEKEVGVEILNVLLKPVLMLDSDKELTAQINKVLSRSLLNGVKVDSEIFKDKKNWRHVLPMKAIVLKEALAPFFLGLASMFGALKD